MSKVVEPPVLLSRALTFVLATSLVVLAALGVTLIKMIPLERPEVFFLLTPTRINNLTIQPMNPDSSNEKTIEFYKSGFIREYIIARNTTLNGPDAQITKDNWIKVVKPWSAPKVYDDFENTYLYKQYMFKEQPSVEPCKVYFSDTGKEKAVVPMRNGWYNVNFYLVCEKIGGQPTQELFKIKIRIQSELEEKASGILNNLERLHNNPLGIQVTEYTVESASGDPLNFGSGK